MQSIAYLVTRSDTIGGSHIHVRDLSLAMINQGVDVHVIIGGDGPIIEDFKRSGLNVIPIKSLVRNLSPFKDIKALYEIKKVLQKIKPDIVSTHSSKAGFLGRLAARYLDIPVLFTAHGWSFTSGKMSSRQILYKNLEKIVTPFTDLIITVSEYDRHLALNNLNIEEDSIITVHNGMKDIEPSLYAENQKNGPVHLVQIARFDHQKDHLELLDAIRTIENIHVHFVGDGPLLEDVKQKAKEIGMTEQITFWGRLGSVDEVLSKCQIFTLISNWEGFPRSTLEAMRAGLPTVVSDVGGAGEAVVDGVTGYIIQKGDVNRLRKVIKDLVQDMDKRKRMGKKARERYENHYTFDIMFEKTQTVYQKVLKNRI